MDKKKFDAKDAANESDYCDGDDDDDEANYGIADGGNGLLNFFFVSAGENEGEAAVQDEDDGKESGSNKSPGQEVVGEVEDV